MPRLSIPGLWHTLRDALSVIDPRAGVAAVDLTAAVAMAVVTHLALMAVAILAAGSIPVEPAQMLELSNGRILELEAQLGRVDAATVLASLVTCFGAGVLVLMVMMARAAVGADIFHPALLVDKLANQGVAG